MWTTSSCIKKHSIRQNNKNGVVYTPKHIVLSMLDLIDYQGQKILTRHVIDNSCGLGSFLVEVVTRYINEYLKEYGSTRDIEKHLEKYIHGIEIDTIAKNECINNLNAVLAGFKIFKEIRWDIVLGDALKIRKFNQKMDYVVGNPPYVRVHNLSNIKYREFNFSKNGMTDLYIIFFEIGINMLNNDGQLVYITPNSYFTSKAAALLRRSIFRKKMLKNVIDLKHYNPFSNTTTYTAITHLTKSENFVTSYFEYNKALKTQRLVNVIQPEQYVIDGQFYFSTDKKLAKLRKIFSSSSVYDSLIKVRNGASTNLDSFFYSKNHSGFATAKAYKISKGEYTRVFFPYDNKLKLHPLNKIERKNSSIFKKLIENKEKLVGRDLQKQQWYEFGRTQSLKDISKERLVINNIIKKVDDIKIRVIPQNTVVYSGYYVTSSERDLLRVIQRCIKSQEFVDYLMLLGKHKNHEYYFYSAQDLMRFISYSLSKRK